MVGLDYVAIILMKLLLNYKNSLTLQVPITLKSIIMKKLALLLGIVILSLNVFCQNRGDMYIMTGAKASLGKIEGTTYNSTGSVVSTEKEPLSTYLGIDVGFGYFVAKNFRLELALSGYYEKNPREKASAIWLNNKYKGFCVCPSLSYYVRLAEKFYYAPEIGVNFDFGKYSYDETYSTSWNCPYRGYSIYANLVAFMYRVGPHFGLWAGLGELSYSYSGYYDEGKLFYSVNSTAFSLNKAFVVAQIYF